MTVDYNKKESGETPDLLAKHNQWKMLTFYEKFEQGIALVLTLLISVIIVSALFQLLKHIFRFLIVGALDPIELSIFQKIFGMIMTLLIAMEFKHSILRVVLRKEGIIQVKTVVLIAILAISRKFIIVDAKAISAAELAALSGALLALGIVYRLVTVQDEKKFYKTAKRKCA